MKKILFACALPLCFSTAQAQVSLHIDIGLPVAPPLVEVQPGIRVVEGFDGEVFFSNGWYWARRPDGWYRARSPRESFVFIERRRVPRALVLVPEGRYRNWHHDNGRHEGWDKHHEGRGDDDRGHGHGHGHGKGHGHDRD